MQVSLPSFGSIVIDRTALALNWEETAVREGAAKSPVQGRDRLPSQWRAGWHTIRRFRHIVCMSSRGTSLYLSRLLSSREKPTTRKGREALYTV